MKNTQAIEFNVFGKQMMVERKDDEWLLFLESGSGFKSRVTEIVIPDGLEERELDQFLDDMYHEMASEEYPAVFRVE